MHYVKDSWMLSPTLSVTIERADYREGTFEAFVRKGPHSATLDAALCSGELSCGDYVLSPNEISRIAAIADDVADRLDELEA